MKTSYQIIVALAFSFSPIAPAASAPLLDADHPPKFLTLVKHSSSEGNLNLNPGFYTPHDLVRTPNLQTCLDKELAKHHTIERWGRNIGMTLVDLTGEKLNHPEFADYNSNAAFYAASQAKAGALLGAHQMLFDLQSLAEELALKGQKDAKSLMTEALTRYGSQRAGYTFTDKFAFTETPTGTKVDFTPQFDETINEMVRMSNNHKATEVIQKVGFNYINSVLWQAGLYDPKRNGGLWVGRAYAGGESWNRDPLHNLSHASTPLAMAKYMTLVAQGRLVSAKISERIKHHLANSHFPIKFIQGLADLGLKVNEKGVNEKNPTKRAIVLRKSGSMGEPNPVSHDATIIYRDVCADPTCKTTKELRYVATGASQGAATHGLSELVQYMDHCIQVNNGVSAI